MAHLLAVPARGVQEISPVVLPFGVTSRLRHKKCIEMFRTTPSVFGCFWAFGHTTNKWDQHLCDSCSIFPCLMLTALNSNRRNPSWIFKNHVWRFFGASYLPSPKNCCNSQAEDEIIWIRTGHACIFRLVRSQPTEIILPIFGCFQFPDSVYPGIQDFPSGLPTCSADCPHFGGVHRIADQKWRFHSKK